jgi:hypothetical protein
MAPVLTPEGLETQGTGKNLELLHRNILIEPFPETLNMSVSNGFSESATPKAWAFHWPKRQGYQSWLGNHFIQHAAFSSIVVAGIKFQSPCRLKKS